MTNLEKANKSNIDVCNNFNIDSLVESAIKNLENNMWVFNSIKMGLSSMLSFSSSLEIFEKEIKDIVLELERINNDISNI